METRRSFIKKAGLLGGGAAFMNNLPDTLQRALAINPPPGSTFYDAEHIIFLMQENRSFDHTLGMLQGVRGFNDPRAIHLPDNNKVWLQTNARGETYLPFPFDMNNTKITWMGGLAHSWADQVDARNGGRYDKWLHAKNPGGEYDGMPFALGYFSRKDIPFYYSLADCFTVCDQNFCSSLTGTTPNRMYFWSGTIREKMSADTLACVWNHDADHGAGEPAWKTYPERLEENGISWKVYQNALYLDTGLGDAQPWLDNFGDNPLEYFKQYQTRMHPEYIAYLPEKIRKLEAEIAEKKSKLNSGTVTGQDKKGLEDEIRYSEKRLSGLKEEVNVFTVEKWAALPDHIKNIHQKAFDINRNDPHYRELMKVKYMDNGMEREIDIPKGDILKNFRDDVNNGKLPAVSWIAAPEHFSDHPTSAWFGAWYVSEVMDILTKNPEVWKKTILVLTYDENDGYFDHIPPYGTPNPYRKDSGKVSAGIDTSVEFVKTGQQSLKEWARESNIGLGYRVPMIIASPWTRGGNVCSQVFDHTSSLRFLEKFLEKKTGKKIREDNITEWRRTVCGDLTSVFQPYNGELIRHPTFLEKEKFIEQIYNARFKEEPGTFKKLGEEEIAVVNNEGHRSSLLPRQEKGIRTACPLPYELYVNGRLAKSKNGFEISFEPATNVFGDKAAGSPFYVYMMNAAEPWRVNNRDYAVKAGDKLKDEWQLSKFENNIYSLHVYGPNGFYRMFTGNSSDPLLDIQCGYGKKINGKITGNLLFTIMNNDTKNQVLIIKDNSYQTGSKTITIAPGRKQEISLSLEKSFGWYDIAITVKGKEFYLQQFAGHVETGELSKTDPLMGGLV